MPYGIISDAIWHQRSCSALVQVMACCLMSPSHYLNQCWLTIHEIFWHSFQGNIYMNTQDISPQGVFEIYTFEIAISSPKWAMNQYLSITLNPADSTRHYFIEIIIIFICNLLFPDGYFACGAFMIAIIRRISLVVKHINSEAHQMFV